MVILRVGGGGVYFNLIKYVTLFDEDGVTAICWLLPIYMYMPHLQELFDFFSFQICDWVVSCPLHYIYGYGFLRYDVTMVHISTSHCCFFIASTNSYII